MHFLVRSDKVRSDKTMSDKARKGRISLNALIKSDEVE